MTKVIACLVVIVVIGGSVALWMHTLAWLATTAMPQPWCCMWATVKLFAAQWVFGWLVMVGRRGRHV